MKAGPTQERLKTLLCYNPNTGIFTWRIRRKGMQQGDIAGHIENQNKGYSRIRVDNVKYGTHRLAWLYMTGEWPLEFIDHIDGDPRNNRINNLRPASARENLRNARKPCTNKSGFKGVCWMKSASGKNWKAEIRIAGEKLYLGIYYTKEEAAEVIRKKREELHGEFANHG